MTGGFESFLREHEGRTRVDGLGGWPEWRQARPPVDPEDLRAAEERLLIRLPDSYRHFVRTRGSGAWCHEEVLHPDDLSAAEEDAFEIGGYIALVGNVRGMGEYVAFNPRDPASDGERPMTHVCHAHGRVADSFEAWTRLALEAHFHPGGNCDFYEAVAGAEVDAAWGRHQASRPRKGWQFWRR